MAEATAAGATTEVAVAAAIMRVVGMPVVWPIMVQP
jgi:hypothetical protein